nr:hypothetical protein [Tanacetum cinerariifolium]
KSDAAEGFEQIIDFLSGSYINHVLTVNPHVYISCIKQFWNTSVVKRTGDVTMLQALVDKKRIVISEEVRKILQLNDAEGVICLPNEEIFAGLTRMRYEKPTSWNDFSSAMASALICLSSGQRFNFLKYIFESLVRNVDSSSKFYMVRKGFSGVETPLFENMLAVRDIAEEAEAQVPAQGDDVQEHAAEEVATNVISPIPTSPSPSSPVIPSSPPHQPPCLPQPQDAEAAQQQEIVKLKARVKKLEKINKVKSSKLRRLKKDEGIELVVDQEKDAEDLPSDTPADLTKVKDKGKRILIEAPRPIKKKDHIVMDAEYARKLQEEINKEHEKAYKNIDWNDALDHVQYKEPQYIKRYHGIKKKPQNESEARKNLISYLKNTEGYKMEFFKGKTYDEILPIFQARFDANMKFLFKSREEMEKEDEEIIKSINETPAQKAAKRRKLSEEAQEADDLRKRLEIVQDEDDDVFVEATPLAQKVPVVDYQVVVIDNKPKYKIIIADDTHQFYNSFITLLKNFDREDL